VLRERKSISDQEYDEVEARAQGRRRRGRPDREDAAGARGTPADGRGTASARPRPTSWPRCRPWSAMPASLRRRWAGCRHQVRPMSGRWRLPGAPLLTIEGGGSFRLEVALEQSRIAVRSLPGTPVPKSGWTPPGDTGGNVELSGRVAEVVPAADPGQLGPSRSAVDLPANYRDPRRG
jgi:hypothetical protein